MSNTFLFVAAVLIWGSTWLAIEFQLGVVAPEVSLVYRSLAASFMLFIWCNIKGLQLRFNLKAHLWFALMGLLLFGLNYVLAYRAQIYIISALCAIAFSTLLWMNIINSRIFFGVYLTLLGRIGAHKAGYVTVMFPVVALILSILFEGLRLDRGLVAGTLLVLSGNLLVLTNRRERTMAA